MTQVHERVPEVSPVGVLRRHVSFSKSMDEDHEDDEKDLSTSMKLRRKSVAAEKYDPAQDIEPPDRVIYPKTDAQRKRLQDSIKHVFLLRSLDAEQMLEVVDAMFERKVEANAHIIDEGDDGDNFYVIESGSFNVYVRAGADQNLVGQHDNQGSFGELALMYNQPRSATIVATTPGSLWALDRQSFKKIILRSAYKKRRYYEGLLCKVPIFSTVTDFERMTIADALLKRLYQPNETIVHQGDDADGMYFIQEGTIAVKMQDESGNEKEITRLSKGDYFGELALVNHKPRSATVIAIDDVTTAFLDKAAFERLLGPCLDLIKGNFKVYEEQLSTALATEMKLTDDCEAK